MSARLEIAQWRASYIVPPRTRDPAGTRAQLDRMIVDEVAPALGSRLERAFSATDETIWLIRRLDLDVLVSLEGLEAAALPERFATAVAARILGILGQASQGADVLRFANRAAFLAYFLRDLVSGRAWDCWQYRCFDGLRHLPVGTATRETFLREPEHTTAVWKELRTKGWMEMVLAGLSDRDLEAIAQWLSDHAKTPFSGNAIQLLVAALANGGLEREGGRWRTPRNAVRLLVTLGAVAEGATLPLAIIDDVLVLADLMADAPLSALNAAFDATDKSAKPRPDRGDAEAVRWLVKRLMAAFEVVPATVQTLVTPLVAKVAPTAAVHEVARSIVTRYASAFLLLPSLARLGFDLASPQFRYQLLGRCMASSFRRAESRDDGLALAAGLPDDAPVTVPEPPAEVRWLWLGRLLELGRWDGEHLATERVVVRGRSLLLLRDPDRDVWLSLGPSLRDGLSLLRAASGVVKPRLTRTGCRTAERDTAFLSLAPEAPIEPGTAHAAELDDMLDLAARSVLRDFALRLPGFSDSSLAHLFSEFLEGSGVVAVEPGHRLYDVRLPAAPLHMLLRLAGAHRDSPPLPWPPHALLHLTIPE